MKTMKKIMAVLLSVLFIAASFAACANDGGSIEPEAGAKLKVGVIQYATHPSLDNCYEGLKKGLTESTLGERIEIDYQNGNGDSATCDSIAKKMVSEKYDMIIGIATPAVVSAYGAAKGTDIPVIFCSVSDPVAAGLVTSLEAPGGNCTGTSDMLDFAEQLNVIQAFQPDVKKIGVLYTTSEANSVSQLAKLTDVAKARGIEIVGQGVQTAADVPQAAAALAGKVECINNLTDNNVVNNLPVVIEAANKAGIPVYGSEIEQVKNGCLASYSIDYVKLGQKTGEMAVEVLNGKAIGQLSVEKFTAGSPVMNTEVSEQLGLTAGDSLKGIETVTTNK